MAITNAQFNNAAINNLGVTVTRTPVTKTLDNDTGQATFVEGTTNNLVVVFENTEPTPTQDSEGRTVFIEARIFVKSDATVNVDDKITYNSIDYRVLGVHIRKFQTNTIFTRVDLVRLTAI